MRSDHDDEPESAYKDLDDFARRRVPPHNLEAERCVLGGCFWPHDGYRRIEVGIRAEDFHSPWHRIVWESLEDLRRREIPADYMAVKNDLERKLGKPLGKDEDDRLIQVSMEQVPTGGNTGYYARIVVALAQKRTLIETGMRIAGLGWSSEPVRVVHDQASELLFAATTRTGSQKIVPAPQLAAEYYDFLGDEDRDHGVESGWLSLDEVIQCFRPGEMTVVGARPSIGKTSFALSLLRTMAERGFPVGMVSLEMERLQLTANMLSAGTSIDSTLVRRGVMSREDVATILSVGLDGLAQLGEKLVVFDEEARTVNDVRRVAERMVAKYGTRLVVIDYMQLLDLGEKTSGRYEAVTEISKRLKLMARGLKIHVVALAQLSRKVEERRDKKPIMSDLRDSGFIEQDADVIVMLHRPEHYFPEDESLERKAWALVVKNRNGPTGEVPLTFDKHYTRFGPA